MESNTHSRATDAPPIDAAFTLGRDQRRSAIVAALSEREAPIALQELATAITTRETEIDCSETPGDRAGTVAVALHHVDLPKLDDTGILDYDAETNAVTAVRTEKLTPE